MIVQKAQITYTDTYPYMHCSTAFVHLSLKHTFLGFVFYKRIQKHPSPPTPILGWPCGVDRTLKSNYWLNNPPPQKKKKKHKKTPTTTQNKEW